MYIQAKTNLSSLCLICLHIMVPLFCFCLKGTRSHGRRALFEDVLCNLYEILSLFVGGMKGRLSLNEIKPSLCMVLVPLPVNKA